MGRSVKMTPGCRLKSITGIKKTKNKTMIKKVKKKII